MTAAARPRAVMTKIKALTPAPWNPRTISKERFENLKRAIKRDPEMLWHRPVLAIRDGTVYAGNMRLRAATALGMTEVPAIVEPITLEQARERALRDNGSWGEYDEQALAEMLARMEPDGRELVGFDDDELERLLATVQGDSAIPDEDIDLTPPAEPESRVGDRYDLGPHRLVVGDATEALTWRTLTQGLELTAMWTDPPYGVSYVGKTADALTIDNDDERGTRALLRDVWTHAQEHLPPGAPIYVATPSGSRMGLVFGEEYARAFQLHQTLVWIKNAMVLGHSDYHYQHEGVIYGWRRGAKRPWYGERDQTTIVRDERTPLSKMDRKALEAYARELEEQLTSDVRRVDRPGRSAEHPTMKPPQLIAPMLRNSTRKGQVVVDPFAGSGSTMVAALATERRAAMIELDPRYADVVVRRWENLSGETIARPKRRRTA